MQFLLELEEVESARVLLSCCKRNIGSPVTIEVRKTLVAMNSSDYLRTGFTKLFVFLGIQPETVGQACLKSFMCSHMTDGHT